ncbi:AMMECR1 domain-containing protein [Xylariaceae sp. FL0804]|nr:AMMECR1 domain-containing protein [Xylariaceae sp. FL0804]
MASIEHCLYCFETLAAHLGRSKPMSLEEVRQSWEEYCLDVDATSDAGGPSTPKKQSPAVRRLAATSSSSGLSSPSSGSTMSLDADTPATSTSSLAAADDTRPTITESPLFVTWNTVSARDGSTSLRGCIGTFEAQELDSGLASYAVTSAVHDTRFEPVSRRELPDLEAAVTLLTDFEDCAGGPMDWTLGTHGLRVSFTDRGRRYGATYLPDVAPEQGWTKEETLVSLMRKAGWQGRRDQWQDVKLRVVRYQGRKVSLRYPEYRRWRDWVDARAAAADK